MAETRKGFNFNNPDITSDYLAPRWGYLVHPDELRYSEAFGNPLIAEADSSSITDEQLSDFIRVAIRYVEVELNIDILPRRIRYDDRIDETGKPISRTDIIEADKDFTSKMSRKHLAELYVRELGYPYRVIAARRECFIKLRRRPVRDILKFDLVDPYYSNTVIDLMPYRHVKKGFSGIAYCRPRQLSARFNTYQYIWQNYLLMPYLNDRADLFLIDYETGYENCQDVPDEFRYIVSKLAACTLLVLYGLGKAAGIASRSVSLNSVSESISTTQSAENTFFGATIMQHRKDIKAWFDQNRSKYSRTLIGNL